MKVMVFLFLIGVLKAAESAILYERILPCNAGNAGLVTDITYPDVYRVIDEPREITKWKEYLALEHGIAHVEFSQDIPENIETIRSSRKDITYLGMGEFRFTRVGKGFLYTGGVRDCIVIVAFDPSGKCCLYHCSKMEIRTNECLGAPLFEAYFVPEFKREFSGLNQSVYLISGCYSADLSVLLGLLKKHEITVSGTNIPDAYRGEDTREMDGSGLVTKGFSALFIDASTTKIEGKWVIPDTSVFLNTYNGQVSIGRIF